MSDPVLKDLESLKIDRRGPARPPRKLPTLLVWAGILGGLGWLGYAQGVPRIEAMVFRTEVSTTEIAVVTPSATSAEWNATGYLVPQRISQVSAKVSGTVVEVFARQGDRVAKGKTILALDASGLEAQLTIARSRVTGAEREVALAERQAEAARRQVGTARAAVVSAQARATTADHEIEAFRWRSKAAWSALAEVRVPAERARRLVDKGVGDSATAEDLEARLPGLEGAARAADVDIRMAEARRITAEAGVESARTEVAKAEADVATAEAQVENAREQVALARAQVDALLVDLNSYTVETPIDGILLVKPPELGEMVGPQVRGLGNTSGTIEIADLSTLVVEADIPEGRIARVAIGGPCEIVLDAFPGKRYRGRVLEVVPRVNRAKATVAIKVQFGDAVEGLLPDMAARVGFLAQELADEALQAPSRVVVPATAIAERGGATVVFVLEGDVVRMTPIEVGETEGGGRELLRGPPPGTKVVDRPGEGLQDGQRIKEKVER